MKSYNSKSGKSSGVTGYETGSDYIIVQFVYSIEYKYSYASAGEACIETMKRLALSSRGLGTYISKHAPPYESKHQVHPAG